MQQGNPYEQTPPTQFGDGGNGGQPRGGAGAGQGLLGEYGLTSPKRHAKEISILW